MKTFKEITAIVSAEIAKLDWTKQPKGLYEPIGYVLALGGKRIRPALTLMACDMFGGNLEQAIAPALGLEVFHNFTLLHDDIMDRAEIRRGQPTVHVKWNDNTAILSGDVMQIAAYQLIAKTPLEELKPVLDLFSRTAVEICEGQQMDMEFENREVVCPTEYLEMIRLKTAVLLACSLKIGALIGGAQDTEAQLLYDFGINIGLAFQLKDDLLDVYGDEESFGKKIGGDILCNKKTYLLIHALKLAQGDEKVALHHWLNVKSYQNEEKIVSVTNIFNTLGVKKICEEKMSYFYGMAVACLERLQVEENQKLELRILAEKLMSRND